jgi:hypothetical protein
MKCSSSRLTLLAIGLVSISAWAQQSFAAQAVYFGRDDSTTFMTSFPNSQATFNTFTAALTSFGVDGADSAVGFDPSLTFGATGITAKANGTLAQAAPGFMIGAQALLESDAAGFPQVNTVFSFNKLINAFGAYVIQGGDGQSNNNPTTFRLRNTNTNTFVDVPVQVGPNWGQDNAFFIGIIDTTPFNEVSLLEAGDFADGMLYDNVVAGVPEPSTIVLLAFGGLAVLGRTISSRRTRRAG